MNKEEIITDYKKAKNITDEYVLNDDEMYFVEQLVRVHEQQVKNRFIFDVSNQRELLITCYNYIQENDIDHNIPQRIERMVDVYLKNKL